MTYDAQSDQYLLELDSLLEANGTPFEDRAICIEYATNLRRSGLPVIFDRDHLAFLLGITLHDLMYFVMQQDDHYARYYLSKKRGGRRPVDAPSERLKSVQRWILSSILEKMRVSDYAFGFVKGRSLLENARVHLGKHCVVNVDIEDFFASVQADNVFRVFSYYGYSKEVSFCLSRLCTLSGVLPQGAPTSPCISNLVFLKVDKRLARLAKTYEASYSRYADDLTFPAEEILGISFLRLSTS